MEVDVRGIILTDNVDLNWLNELTPRYYPDFVKFVVSTATNRVVVGMDIHASAQAFLDEDESNLYGGNIYRDGSIVYESTLNIQKNLALDHGKTGLLSRIFKRNSGNYDNPRIIVDKDLIETINAVLFSWVKI